MIEKFTVIPKDEQVNLIEFSPEDTDELSKKDIKKEYTKLQETFIELQEVLYAFVVPIFFFGWLEKHEALAMGIWYVLIGLVILSWIVTIHKKILRRWQQKQI